MKKLGAVLIILIVVLVGCKPKKSVVLNQGVINMLNGHVYILDNNKKIKAKIKDLVKEGMIIETGKRSFVDIYIGENAIKIMEDSKVTFTTLLRDITANTEKTEIMLSSGKAFSKISRKLAKGDSYLIKTPTTVAGVRGTDFLISQQGNKAEVSCLDGKVQVKKIDDANNKWVDLNGGQKVEVDKNKDLTVESIKADNLKYIEQIKKDFEQMRDEIRKSYEDTRKEQLKQVTDLKDENKKMVQDQKDQDKKNIQEIKDKFNQDKMEINKGMDEQKNKQKDEVGNLKNQKDDVNSLKDQKDAVKGIKQKIQKFDTNINK